MSTEVRTISEYAATAAQGECRFSTWTAQSIVYELIKNFMIAQTPAALSLPLKLKYKEDPTESDITLDINYKYDAAIASKRPAVFVGRGDIALSHPTFQQTIGGNSADSESSRMTINNVPVTVTIIASPVMTTELLTEYVKYPLLCYQKEIQEDFNLRRFRVTGISKPSLYPENKDYFIVTMNVNIAYDEGWTVRGKDLKIKTVSWKIYNDLQANTLI